MSKLLRLLAFLPLGLLFSAEASAQLGDRSLYSESPRFSHQYRHPGDSRYFFIDTNFNSLHWYHQFNHANEDLFGSWQMTNDGGALLPLQVHSRITESITRPFSLGPYQEYFFQQNELPFYQVRSPLTEANYWMGYQRGQSFNFYHTQNITPHWNAYVDLRTLNSAGLYNHNRNVASSGVLTTNFRTPKELYKVDAYLQFGKLTIDEFGGLAEVDTFLADPPANKLLANVNLDQDERVLRRREFYLDQKVNLLQLLARREEADTNVSDSLSEDAAPIATKERGKLNLGHSFQYLHQSRVYRQYDPDFYPNYFRGTPDGFEALNDSVAYRGLLNQLYLETEFGQKNHFSLKTGLLNLITLYNGSGFELRSNNLGVNGNLSGRVGELVDVEGQLEYIFSGALQETFDINTKASIRLLGSLRAFGGYRVNHSYPDYYYQLYYGNNYSWQENFDKQIHSELRAGLRWGKANALTLSSHSFINYSYFGDGGRPIQAAQAVRAQQLQLRQNFSLWGFLHQDNDIVYQQVSGATEALPLPELLTRNSLYFEFYLFKRALKCLVGTELNYFSSYLAPNYNPAIGEFVNQDEVTVGNYPVFDLFANFALAKARIFVKYGHVNQGFTGNNYLITPLYPMVDRTLRVGISWRFFN